MQCIGFMCVLSTFAIKTKTNCIFQLIGPIGYRFRHISFIYTQILLQHRQSTIFKIKLFFTFITFHGLTILAALPIPQLDLTILILWGGRKWTVRERKRKGSIEGENSPLSPCMYPPILERYRRLWYW